MKQPRGRWPRMRRDRRLVFAAATIAGLVGSASAFAIHVDSMFPTANYSPNCVDGSIGDTFCQTDNSALTVFRQSSLSSQGKQNIKTVLDREFAPTDLSISYPSSPSYSGGAETDIIYQQRDGLSSSTAGISWCNDAVDTIRCDQHYAAFPTATPDTTVACHETGHGVGLTHGQQAYPRLSNTDTSLQCMKSPTNTSDLGTHNTAEIQVTY